MPTTHPEQTTHPRGLVAVLAFAGMGASFMQTILIPIQSELPRLLDSTRESTAWVITVTLLVSAVCTPISGKLGDMYGKRKVAVVLLALLTAGSIICALSPTVVPMIVGRALQGTGMGVIPLGISILRDALPPARLGPAIALVSATLGVGGAVGLPISATVTQYADWHVLFWVAAAIGVAALVLFVLVVPASTVRAPSRLDLVGALGLAVVLTSLLLAVSKGGEWGWTSAATLVAFAVGVVALPLWFDYELRRAAPLVDLRLAARRPILLTNLASVAMGFALFSSNIVLPQLLQLPTAAGGLGVALIPASLVLMPAGLAMLAMSPVAGRLSGRLGPRVMLSLGAGVIALGYLMAVVLPTSVAVILLLNTIIGVGIGLGYAAMPSLILRAVPATQSGAANGLNTLMRALGTAVAAAVVATVLAQSAGEDGVPTAGGFDVALLLGLAAAVISGATALLIPRVPDPVVATVAEEQQREAAGSPTS